ncbi:RING-H2 finger protein ATL52-like [Juglans microcarpa x Juglans regia]|uniref:RING-H2 finger protein ATL52-like n=1 Tax=Juglans microcarpa x Juglans regia TaxID=2249226 RepID=UPI001B7EF4D7|nr:RING-H2 finger protein ATL52-like [Juglans microcarpa x Juglans regia]
MAVNLNHCLALHVKSSPSSFSSSNLVSTIQIMNSIYYAIIPMVSIVVALVIYGLALYRWRAYNRLLHPATTSRHDKEKAFGSKRLNPFLASTFKYKKGTANTSKTDSALCLTNFEDDEHIHQLPRCKHSFHAPCIDMWLFSHSNCPLCRTPVDRLSKQPEENSSREVLVSIGT